MNITKDMVTVFNQALESLNCSFRLRFEGDTRCKVVPSNDTFIRSSIINLTDDFYKMLEAFFNERGVKLHYNNDRTIFWS